MCRRVCQLFQGSTSGRQSGKRSSRERRQNPEGSDQVFKTGHRGSKSAGVDSEAQRQPVDPLPSVSRRTTGGHPAVIFGERIWFRAASARPGRRAGLGPTVVLPIRAVDRFCAFRLGRAWIAHWLKVRENLQGARQMGCPSCRLPRMYVVAADVRECGE